MTDEKTRAEQIALIKGSVEAWNAWRVGRTDKPDLSGANMRWDDLSWADLSGTNLVGADLRWADLSGANMSGADVSWANMRWADVSWANMSHANMSWANMSGADMSWANMSHANMRHANMSGADMSGTNMSHADMRHANLRDADMRWIDLRDANMSDANLVGANLRCINLSLASRREGFKIHRLIARVSRSDSHLFMGFLTDAGLIIMAGCRLMSPDEYRAHVAKEYPDTPKAEETLGVIQYIEDCAKEQEKEGWTADDQ